MTMEPIFTFSTPKMCLDSQGYLRGQEKEKKNLWELHSIYVKNHSREHIYVPTAVRQAKWAKKYK